MDPYCECGGPWALHYAPNDVAVILNQKVAEECAHCARCPKYRHAKGTVPKPRAQPTEATIKAVREAEYRRTNPPPHPVRDGVRNTYSREREIPM